MNQDRRRLWTILISICLFAPFVVLLILSLAAPIQKHPLPLSDSAAASNAGPGAPASPLPAAATTRLRVPLFAAGDGHVIWLAVPRVDDAHAEGFELLSHAADSSTWHASTHNLTQTHWTQQGFPQALLLYHLSTGESIPYIIGSNGWINRYSMEDSQSANELPGGQDPKAAAGGNEQLFVITRTSAIPIAVPTSAPATTAATSSPAATAPATQPASPAPFNCYWFPPPSSTAPAATQNAQSGSNWVALAPLGTPGADPARVPTHSSWLSLAAANGRLIALWIDPSRPSTLVVRALDFAAANSQWSEPIDSEIPQAQAPGGVSRLYAIFLDGTLYALWTVPTGNSVELCGGWLSTDPKSPDAWKLLPVNFLQPMSLGAAGQGIFADQDVAVAPAENSILAIIRNREDLLTQLLFDDHGRPISSPTAVEAQSPRPGATQIGQNIAMVLFVLLMTLSLWQWRQKSAEITLPAGTVIAPLHLRAAAFFIDVVIPYIIILVVFNIWKSGGNPFSLITSWINSLSRPEELVQSPELLAFLGLYLVHVTLGELFFRRSLGKACVGLRVAMYDGTPATAAAVLIRNAIRLPEVVVAIAAIYICLSDRRQRLGDLLAHTLVVAQQPAEEDNAKK